MNDSFRLLQNVTSITEKYPYFYHCYWQNQEKEIIHIKHIDTFYVMHISEEWPLFCHVLRKASISEIIFSFLCCFLRNIESVNVILFCYALFFPYRCTVLTQLLLSPTFCFYFQLLISTLRSNISLYVFPLTFGIQGGRRQHHIFSFIRRHAIFPKRISQKMHDWKAKQIFGDFSFECDIRQCW